MARKWLILSLVGLAIVGCTKQAVTQPSENSSTQGVQNTQVTETVSPSTQSQGSTVVKSGSFVKGEHTTKGSARIITENGKTFLELDQKFQTEEGPDVLVILHRQAKPKIYGITKKDYVSLGRLQKTSGTQRYAIADNVKIADFASVAVWCRKFNATFGYAAFTK